MVGSVLFLIALVVGWLEFGLPNLFVGGYWRGVFLNPCIIFYIILIAPELTQMENKVISTIIILGGLSEEKINNVFKETHAIHPIRELLAFGAGIIIITIIMVVGGNINFEMFDIFHLVTTAITFGLLSWTAYASLISIRITAELIVQPLRVNLFDLEPFKVIGKSSLYLSLAFIGGITLAIIFSAPDLAILQNWEFWLVNIPILMIPVIIFFWNMKPTHQIIDTAKRDSLRKVGQEIHTISDSILNSKDSLSNTERVSQRLQGLIILEERLEKVQTWPYDVSTLRTLLGSILVPALTVFGQVLLRSLFGL